MNVLPIARDYIAAGVCVVPMRLDGSKRPALPGWKEYQERMPSDDELATMFAKPAGIGIICGAVSSGVEVLDFDNDPDRCFNAWKDQLTPEIRGRLTVIETGGGGYHAPYRCSRIGGNEKIAMPAEGKPYVETRGQGGLIVGVGSPIEVHASGQPYVQVMGQPLPELPTFTPDERKAMFAAARALDERGRDEVVGDYIKSANRSKGTPEPVDPSTPWGAFDLQATWSEVLEPHGWKASRGGFWTRPNKKFGTSARVVKAANDCEVLCVYSTSAGALSPVTGDHQTWGKFGAYAALNHSGDRREAARAVREMGYGDQSDKGWTIGGKTA